MKQNRVFSLVGRGEAEQDVLSSRGGGVKQNTVFSLLERGEAEQGILSSREG